MEVFSEWQQSALGGNPSRVRFELLHVPKIASGKGLRYILRVTDLCKVFPFAMQVWAEAASPYESNVDMEVVRAFNISRRMVDSGSIPAMEESVASVAAQGGSTIREDIFADRIFRAIRGEADCGYWTEQGNFVDGDRVELQCGGCYARFVSRAQQGGHRLDSSKVYDTRREFLEHRRRASAIRGPLALC
jgi:hypothetical protein